MLMPMTSMDEVEFSRASASGSGGDGGEDGGEDLGGGRLRMKIRNEKIRIQANKRKNKI